ncbi:hypothetical protein IAT38_003830 [Cryptococcus sp. DSM 104549]
MTLTPLLYCSICACPCLLPRIEPPPPKVQTGLEDTDTSSASPLPMGPDADWLSTWHCLRVSSGVVDPRPFLFQALGPPTLLSTPTPPTSDTAAADTTKAEQYATKRCIPIHAYCLTAVLSTIRKSQFNSAQTHEEKMMLAWSLPRWSGYGPWVGGKGTREGLGLTPGAGATTGAGGLGVGHWRGTVSQRERWADDGKHLLPEDVISPISVGQPHRSRLPLQSFCPTQTSRLSALPFPILDQIFLALLDEPSLAPPPNTPSTTSNSSSSSSPLLSPSALASFFSLRNTCSELYHFPSPSPLWALITLDSVRRFRIDLLARWRANPTGVGSAAQLWLALESEFWEPVKRALAEAKRIGGDGGGETAEEAEGAREVKAQWTAKDVWEWWRFDERWRSRRRVWYCVVHGCATARDADWW